MALYKLVCICNCICLLSSTRLELHTIVVFMAKPAEVFDLITNCGLVGHFDADDS